MHICSFFVHYTVWTVTTGGSVIRIQVYVGKKRDASQNFFFCSTIYHPASKWIDQ